MIKTTTPTIVLIHSAWLGAWQWANVKKFLEEKGVKVITPDLPGHGSDQTKAISITMDSYLEAISKSIEGIDEPCVLLGHSFNGITISQFAEQNPDKVQALIYLAGFLLGDGESFVSAVSSGVKNSLAVEHFHLSEDDATAHVREDMVHKAFAHDVPKKSFDEAASYMVPEPSKPLVHPLKLSDENFGKIRKYYIECTLDQALPIEVQRAMYADNVKESYSLSSSHTPNFSMPFELASYILEILNIESNHLSEY